MTPEATCWRCRSAAWRAARVDVEGRCECTRCLLAGPPPATEEEIDLAAIEVRPAGPDAIVVGVNVARMTGVVVTQGWTLIAQRILAGGSREPIAQAAAWVGEFRPALVALESRYPRGQAPEGFVALGRWAMALESAGLRVELLRAVPRGTRAGRRQQAETFVREKFGVELGEELAGAACLAAFAARQLAPSGVAVRLAPAVARRAPTQGARDVRSWPIPEARA